MGSPRGIVWPLVPHTLTGDLLWANLLFGTLVGTAVALSEGIYALLRAMLGRAHAPDLPSGEDVR